jgi:hypothetical protein
MGRAAKPAVNTSTQGYEQFTVTVENERVTVIPELIPLDKVHLDPENPRIREALREKGEKSPNLKRLREIIWGMSGVQDLYTSIRDNGGLLERILVRHDGVVVEGNCRTVSYLHLRDVFKGDSKWEAIPAMRLPRGTTDRQIAVIQAYWHVNGKIAWNPHEQAGQLHYMNKTLGMEPKAIAKAIGLQEKVVVRQIHTYETMQRHVIPKLGRAEGMRKYSYVEEFHKNKQLKEFRAQPKAEEWFITHMVNGKFTRGDEVRDLALIVNNERAKQTFEKAGHKAAMKVLAKKDPTIGSPVFKRLQAATDALFELTAEEIERIRTDPRALKLLRELNAAVLSTAKIAKVSLKPR